MSAQESVSRRGISITLKIGLACIAIGILSILITGLSSGLLFQNVLQDAAKARIDSVRVVMQGQINEVIEGWKSGAGSIIQPAFAALQEASAPAAASSFFEQSGLPANEQTNRLKNIASRLGYENILVYRADGTLALNLFEQEIGPPPADIAPQVQQVIEKAKLSVSVVFTGEATPENLRFIVVAPLITTDNQLSGIMVTQNQPNKIFNILNFRGARAADAGLGQTGQAYLVDRNLRPMSPVREKPGTGTLQSEGIRSALAGTEGASSYHDYRGIPVFGSHGRLKVEGLPWGVLVEQSRKEALAPARSVTWIVLLIGLGLITLVGIIGAVIARGFAKPILALAETMRRVGAGDESVRAEVLSQDEIGKLAASFNDMVEERNQAKNRISTENRKLQNNIQDLLLVVADASEGKLSVRAKKTEGVLGNVAEALNQMLLNVGILIGESKRVSAEVEKAAAGITAAAEKLTTGATDQTRQVETTIRDVQNLTEEAQNVSENSREAAASASRTRSAAEAGATSIRDAIAFMDRLLHSVQETARKIDSLGERSHEISGIVRSISEISAETDVLAMNASIEAARAGEHGKGFTIVADQVRALADRTRLATVEIEKLVRSIQVETDEAVRTMETQTREVENGAKQVSSAGQELGNIVEVSIDSSTLAEQISHSASQQENRAEAVLASVRTINRIAEETRAKTLEFQATSDQLANLASELNQQLANFEVDPNPSPTS